MGLTLITGPANAEKARVVLDGVRRRTAEDPILVVPTLHDVELYRRELAASGAVFGPTVVRFEWLVREIARRAGVSARVLAGPARERVVAEAIRRGAPWLARGVPSAGLVSAAGELVAELQRAGVDPSELAAKLEPWAQRDPRRRRRAGEVSGIYGEYRALLDGLGSVDRDLHASRSLEALRAAPERWGGSPAFFYGFDDLTGLELDAVRTLSAIEGVDVTVGLTWEDRPALASRTATLEELGPLADRHQVLEARSDHYAPDSREALHHLERHLFDDPAPGRVPPGAAVRLLESGGERAELELVAAEVLVLLGRGVAPEEVAVVFRSPGAHAALVARVFAEYGVPCSIDSSTPLARTALGRAVLGLLRCAGPDGRAGDLLAYLRAPGVVDRLELVDALERDLRSQGATSAADARARWEASRWRLDAIERLRTAGDRGGAELAIATIAEADRLFAAPHRRAARRLDAGERLEARALAAIREALDGLAHLARSDATLAPSRAEVVAALERVEVRLGEPGAAAVQVIDPLAIRGRRVRALFACGLQEGELPRPGSPEPFLSDEDRASIERAGGLRLRRREAALDDERALFYACASRPREALALSYRTSDEAGSPAIPSFFVDDVRDLFTDDLERGKRTRRLSEVTWPADPPTRREAERARAAAGPRREEAPVGALTDQAVLSELRAREQWSAGQLEAWAQCPVKWLVDRHLRPDSLDPEPEPLTRGNVAHRVLEATFRRLRELTGSGRVTPASLPRARDLLTQELAGRESELPLSTVPARRRAALRRLEADLLRYLRTAAAAPDAFEPTRFELEFGDEEESRSLRLDGDVRVRGRIDRVDLSPDGRQAAVYDYKGSTAHAQATWGPDRRLQVALYMLAVRELLDAEPVAGLYQPLGGGQRARGLVLAGSSLADASAANDVLERDELDARLEEMRELAVAALRELRAGALEPRPRTCAWSGGCAHPQICRCESR